VIGFAAERVLLGGRPVLHGVNVRIAAGTLVALCGPNGAGKSTLLRGLAGLLPETPRPDPRRVAYLPQGARCAWGLTVGEVAALGRIPHRDAAEAPVARALHACGLTGLRGARIDRLSGGQARRAMLARVFATDPDILLLDEPTADLDPAAAHEVMALMAGFAAAGGAVVAVLHALDLAAHYASRMVVLDGGAVVADGAPAQTLPAAAAAFDMDLHAPAHMLLRPKQGVSG
jgi:iron complex transport system ATP-binding protein